MVIDVHTHIFPKEVAKKALPKLLAAGQGNLTAYTDATFDGLRKSMDLSGIDLSVVLPIATSPSQGQGILSWIKTLKDVDSRVLFFASVHPLDPHLTDILKEVVDLGLKGLKLHPQYQNFAVDSKEAYKLYDIAFKNNLILHFHAGFDIGFPKSDLATAFRFANLKKEFPEGTVVLAHAGGYRDWDKVYNLLSEKGFYFDSAFALNALLEQKDPHLINLFHKNQDFFLFGTDSPWEDQKKDAQKVKNSDFFTPLQKELLLFKNAQKLLGLS